ncbi:hypothetical protein HanIR_Chr01g0003471 [Helianthus annuus]|nr:hypothetical protein HanIR_Chr01g0003471 [Helianthus annuus]
MSQWISWFQKIGYVFEFDIINMYKNNAYQNLLKGCSEILAREEQRSRLAWHLSDCFQKDTGRPHFPYCDVKSQMANCLKKLDEDVHKIYLETNAICHQLQGSLQQLISLGNSQQQELIQRQEQLKQAHDYLF